MILIKSVWTERTRAAGYKIVRRRILLLVESMPALTWVRWVDRLERIADSQQIHEALISNVHVPNQRKRHVSFERPQLALVVADKLQVLLEPAHVERVVTAHVLHAMKQRQRDAAAQRRAGPAVIGIA